MKKIFAVTTIALTAIGVAVRAKVQKQLEIKKAITKTDSALKTIQSVIDSTSY